MKFQIVTYNQAKRNPGYPSTMISRYRAMTGPIPGILDNPFRADGDTREEARTKLIALIQGFLNTYPELEVTEVDIQPSDRARQMDLEDETP